MSTRIGIFFFEHMEELDAIGPLEVLAFWARQFPDDDVQVVTFSSDGEPVVCAKGLTVLPQVSAAEVGSLDVLVHPGGRGSHAQLEDPSHLDWLRRQRTAVPLMVSVCTGSLVFARAGLLRNRPATGYWGYLDQLKRIDPSIEVRQGVRFVDDGDVVTSAGISAGLDMSLHLVARLASPERARAVARGIEYDYGEYGIDAPVTPLPGLAGS